MKRKPLSNDRPAIQKSIKIQLPEGRLGLRLALVIVLIALAVGSFALGINSVFSTEPGLAEISALSGEMNAASNFTFYYYLGYSETDATDERRALRSLYTEAATDALTIFSAEIESGEGGLYYLSHHPNEEVLVDAALYSAMATLEESGTRYHYLAPLYEQYRALASSGSDAEAAQYDPRLDAAQEEFVARIAAFAADEDSVSLELLGESRVKLKVSEAYLAFTKENGIEAFLSLGWMENAFVADYLAGVLAGAGYTRGALISEDGFMRCLDTETGTEYTFDFTHREGNTVSSLAQLHFSGNVSLACLRDYPTAVSGAEGYYQYSDGSMRSPCLDTADGLDRCCAPELCAYSFDTGCADLALALAPVFISDTLDIGALETLEIAGISVYYTSNGVLCTTADA